eukprot:g3404.t1
MKTDSPPSFAQDSVHIGGGRGEFEKLAQALAKQTEYNNKLLEELQNVEEERLRFQTDSARQQALLRRTMKSLEAVQSEVGNLRQEYQTTTFRLKQSEDELERARMQVTESASAEAEAKAVARDALGERERLSQEKAGLTERLAKASGELEHARTQLQETRREARDAVSATSAARLAEKRQVQVLEERVASLETENRRLQSSLSEEGKGRAALNKQLTRAVSESRANQDRIKELESVLSTSKNVNDQQQRSLQEAIEKSAKAVEAESIANAEVKRLAQSCEKLQAELSEKVSIGEAERLQREEMEADLRSARKEISEMRRRYMDEKAVLDQRCAELESDIRRVAEEEREKQRILTRQATDAAVLHQDEIRTKDEQYVNLQQEYKQLHHLMERLTEDHKATLRAEREERANLEKVLDGVREDLAQKDEQMISAAAAADAKVLKANQDTKALHQEMMTRTERYIESLGTLRRAIASVSQNAASQEEHFAAVQMEVSRLRASVRSGVNVPSGLDVRKEIHKLTDTMKELKLASETASAMAQEAKIQCEEEKSRNVMLQEEKSRLAFELRQVNQRNAELAKDNEARSLETKNEIEASTRVRLDMESHLKKTLSQLKDANATTLRLQEERQRLEREHDETRALQKRQSAESESALRELRRQNSRLMAEASQSASQRDALRQELLQSASEVKALHQRLERLESEENSRLKAERAQQANYKQQVSGLYASMQGMESQLEQSKKLLATVQKQRALAASESEQLRAELADVYAKLRQERLEDNESAPSAAAVIDVSVSSKGEEEKS